MKIKVLIIGMFLFGFGISAQAQKCGTRSVKKTQIKQQKRIQHGIKSGELTRKEAVGLQAQQVHINRTKKRAKADGIVTPKERAIIGKKQYKASKNIYRQKHDAQARF